MPDVRNIPEAEARAAIEAAGLVVGSVTGQYNDEIPEGNVISQSQAVGSFLERGTNVDLVVSDGRKTVYYSYNDIVNVPSKEKNKEYTAHIELFKAESDERIPINGSNSLEVGPNDFPLSISAADIADCDKGTLVITWTVTEKTLVGEEDGEGGEPVTSTETLPPESRSVSFKPQ